MSLRLALVIDGDSSGAKKALEETSQAVEDLGKSAEETGRKVKGIEWNDAEFDRARNGLKETADEGKRAADSVSAVADAGARAAPEIVRVGDAAGTAGGRFSELSTGLLALASGFLAGVAIHAIGEGLRAAAGYAGDLVREIVSNQPMIERDLKAHEELVRRIKGAWAEANGAASSYGLNSTSLLRFQAQQDIVRLERDLEAALGDAQRGALHQAADPHGGTRASGPEWDRIAAFRQELREGTADVIKFRNELAAIGENLPEGASGRGLIEQILGQTETAAKLQSELERARDLLQGLKGDAEAAATALGGKAEKYRALTEDAHAAGDAIGASAQQIERTEQAATSAIPTLSEYDRLLKSIAGAAPPPDVDNPNRMALTPLLQGRQFASGGFTGHMPADQIAGFVHGREYVFDAESTARIGVANLDAIRAGVRGYASGGVVLPTTAPIPTERAVFGAAPGGQAAALAQEFRLLQGVVHNFGSVLWRTHDAGQALASTIQSVSQRFLDFSLRALDQLLLGGVSNGGSGFGPIANLFGLGGGAGTSYFPPAPLPVSGGLYHGGGRVGPSPSVSRMVPQSVFMDAPRLHTGGWLKPGERPVIAMDGEEIGWPEQLARKYGSGQTVINNFHVETPNPKAFAESRSTVARAAGRLAGRSGRYS